MALSKKLQEDVDKLKANLPASTDDDVLNATAYVELSPILNSSDTPSDFLAQIKQLLFDELRKRNIPNSKVDDKISSVVDKVGFLTLQESTNKLVQTIKKEKEKKIIKTVLWVVAIAIVAYLLYKFVFKGKIQVA